MNSGLKEQQEQEVDIMQEADRILDNYTSKAVKTMMYHACIDAVKRYYKKHKGTKIVDAIARSMQLEFEQYNLVKSVSFSTAERWRLLSQYWCSAEYKNSREACQAARLKPQDVAQDHLWSSNNIWMITTKQLKLNIRMIGSIDPLMEKYNTTCGLPHGCLAIEHGALKRVDVLAATKGSNIRPSNCSSHQNVLRENKKLVQRNTEIAHRYETETMTNREMLLVLYEKFQMEVPPGVTLITGLVTSKSHWIISS